MSKTLIFIIATVFITWGFCTQASAEKVFTGMEWQAVEIPIMSSFGEEVTPENVWPDYPRPQLRRDEWSSLNGLWDYAITDLDSAQPTEYGGKILVPFCVQSSLSGVRKLISKDEAASHALWYQTTLDIPEAWRKKQILLHFGAVDWEAEVWVNDRPVGTHRGGYAPFSFNMSSALRDGTAQTLTVRVTDPGGPLAGESIGKQGQLPEYESVTGIWQPVWLEPVPEQSIERLKLVPDIDREELRIHPFIAGIAEGMRIEARALVDGVPVAQITGSADERLTLELPKPRLWSPDDPFLYDLEVTLFKGDQVVDAVDSYFGMRKVSIGKEGAVNRILLNNEPLFLIGPLDQGTWPESILTPPSESALRFELEFLKKIQCNTVRLHVNTKPDRWYFACDQLGLLVLQDFVNGKFPHQTEAKLAEPRQWRIEQQDIVEALYNHPSVVMWLIFNEGWGQHETELYSQWVGRWDPTRLITAASGYHDVPGLGHVRDLHNYINTPSIVDPAYEADRAVMLGEWGGFVSAAEGHQWMDRRGGDLTDDEWIKSVNWPKYTIGPAFLAHYADVIEQFRYLKELGLSGAIYTQLADMKMEQNGYVSIDRKVTKTEPEALRALHDSLINEDIVTSPIIESSLIQPQTWTYTTNQPAGDWTAPDYDDSEWDRGEGPFGNTPAFILPQANTSWTSDRLYLRNTFSLTGVPGRACLRTYVSGKFGQVKNTCDIYLNGHKVKEVLRWHGAGEDIQVLTIPLRPEALAILRRGTNHVAVEVKSASETKLYDMGIYAVPGHNKEKWR